MRVLPLASAILLLSGCTGTGSGVEMSVDATDRELSGSDRTTITGTATNRGDEAFVYDHPGCPPAWVRFYVTVAGTEREVPSGEPMFGACAIREGVRIEAGDHVETTADWDGRFDGERVAPGTYEVVARLSAAEAPYEVAASVTIVVR
ncbi:MAG: hypothetical protein ACT4PT_09180 [Methanobacteriota archaeon]